jgi:hypothetical protein
MPAESKHELFYLRIGWRRHVAWAILAVGLLLGSGAARAVATHSSGGRPMFTLHSTAPAIGQSGGNATGSLVLADIGGQGPITTISGFGGGPPVP